MQTREELYSVLDYHAYERKLDELNAQAASKGKPPKGKGRPKRR
jgi:hypothetical protein